MKVLIVGGGPAGIFASWVCGMYKMKAVIVDSLDKLGGQCSELYPDKMIYDIPAIKALTGQELVNGLLDQASVFEKDVVLSTQVVNIQKEANQFHVSMKNVITAEENTMLVDGVVIAAGRGAFDFKRAEFLDANICENKSLFYSVSNKELFRNKVIAINGGGDSAGDYAEQLAPIAKKIYLVHRRNKFRFPDSMLDRLKQMDNVEIVTPAYIEKVKHNDGYIAELTLSNDRVLKVENLLCFFGLSNSVDYMSSWGFEMENGKILVDDSYSSSLPGVYAVSDIAYRKGQIEKKLILHAFGEVYTAVYSLSQYLNMNIKIHYSTSSLLSK